MCECARLLLFAVLPAIVGWGCSPALGEAVLGAPVFTQPAPAVWGQVAEPVTLDCTVLRLNDKAISWVRSRDLQILSHAGAVFTADSRVAVTVSRDGDVTRHSLRIDKLRHSDAGRYECQVNTEPKMSLFFNLTVLDEPPPAPLVRITGPRVLHVSPGISTQLSCRATTQAGDKSAPLDVHWLKDDQPLTLQSNIGGVSLDTERWQGRATSRLSLSSLTRLHAGSYACVAGDSRDTVTLHIVDNDTASQMEAMQRDQSPELFNAASHAHLFASLLILPYILVI